jgi:hypothetical protein
VGVRLSPLGTAATTGVFYQPQMIDDGDCGAMGGMKVGRVHWSTWRKPVPVSLCPPQIPHDQTWARTRAACSGKPANNHLSLEQKGCCILLLPVSLIGKAMQHYRTCHYNSCFITLCSVICKRQHSIARCTVLIDIFSKNSLMGNSSNDIYVCLQCGQSCSQLMKTNNSQTSIHSET